MFFLYKNNQMVGLYDNIEKVREQLIDVIKEGMEGTYSVVEGKVNQMLGDVSDPIMTYVCNGDAPKSDKREKTEQKSDKQVDPKSKNESKDEDEEEKQEEKSEHSEEKSEHSEEQKKTSSKKSKKPSKSRGKKRHDSDSE